MGGFRVQRAAWPTKLIRGIGCMDLVCTTLCVVIRMATRGFPGKLGRSACAKQRI